MFRDNLNAFYTETYYFSKEACKYLIRLRELNAQYPDLGHPIRFQLPEHSALMITIFDSGKVLR
jgi:hypothetical protein